MVPVVLEVLVHLDTRYLQNILRNLVLPAPPSRLLAPRENPEHLGIPGTLVGPEALELCPGNPAVLEVLGNLALLDLEVHHNQGVPEILVLPRMFPVFLAFPADLENQTILGALEIPCILGVQLHLCC